MLDYQSQVQPLPLRQTEPTGEDFAVLAWIVRMRWFFFILVGLLIVAGYNGQWRIGRDSSLYRSVARNLADGKGYTFRGERASETYPGLPLMLLAVEKVVGREDVLRPRISLALMAMLAVLTFFVVYQLLALYLPRWVAVCASTGVGISPTFASRAHDLMQDLPFLLGVCLVLLGVGRLQRATAWKARALNLGGVLLPGAIIAVSMRPTFWALALALLGAVVVAIARAPKRAHLIGLAALLLAVATWLAVDPRSGGQFAVGGKQEAILIRHLANVGTVEWWRTVERTVEKHLPQTLFGIELVFPLGTILLIELVVGAFWLMRWSVLWGLYVLATLAMMLTLGSVPRYFLMVLPLLLAEWALLTWWVSSRLKWGPIAREVVMLAGLCMATAVPLFRTCAFIAEQHGFDRSLTRRSFLEVYRKGTMLPLVELAPLIRQHVPEGGKLVGPEPRILSFLSGRDVWHPSEPAISLKRLVPGRAGGWSGAEKRHHYRAVLARRGFTHVVYGRRFNEEKLIPRLLRTRFLIAAPRLAIERNGMVLAPLRLPIAERYRRPARPVAPAELTSTRPAATGGSSVPLESPP